MQSTKIKRARANDPSDAFYVFSILFQQKFDFESRAFRFERERFYRSAVKIDYVFRYRKTQSDAARRPRFFRAIESVEDMRQVFVGDYRTVIIYRKHCFCSVFGKVYANFAALRFVLNRVIDEYHKQPAYHRYGRNALRRVYSRYGRNAFVQLRALHRLLRAELATKKTRSVANAFFS